MKISFIVPVYNVKDYIEDCLNSLINQTYKNIEIIIIDDGSTDGSEDICDKYCKKYEYITVIHKKNGGLSSARNEGLKYVNGEYIVFVDSDDFVSTILCERLIDIIRIENPDLIQYDFFKFLDGEEIKFTNDIGLTNNNNYYTLEGIENIYNHYFIDEKLKRESWTKAYKRSVLDNFSFPLGRLAEDLATTYKIISKCEKIVCIDDYLYFYRLRNNSIMGNGSIKLYYDAMLAHYDIYKFIENNPKYSKVAYTNYFNNLMKLYAKNIIENHNYQSEKIRNRYLNIKYDLLNFKGKLVYLFSKINNFAALKIIYNKFIKNGRIG